MSTLGTPVPLHASPTGITGDLVALAKMISEPKRFEETISRLAASEASAKEAYQQASAALEELRKREADLAIAKAEHEKERAAWAEAREQEQHRMEQSRTALSAATAAHDRRVQEFGAHRAGQEANLAAREREVGGREAAMQRREADMASREKAQSKREADAEALRKFLVGRMDALRSIVNEGVA